MFTMFAGYVGIYNIIATEILALTKLNWNNTQFDSFYPITLKAARQVGDILRHLDGKPPELTRYAYYM